MEPKNREEALKVLTEVTDLIMGILEEREVDDEAAEEVLDLLCHVHATLGPCDCYFCSDDPDDDEQLSSIVSMSEWSLSTNPPPPPPNKGNSEQNDN